MTGASRGCRAEGHLPDLPGPGGSRYVPGLSARSMSRSCSSTRLQAVDELALGVDAADSLVRRVFESLYQEIDGRQNGRGGRYHVDMLPTTCHIYFGSVHGASTDGRRAGAPVSEGISPVQGADRRGPTAVLSSAAKMDHLRTGGSLLNQRFTPAILAGDDGIEKLAHLVRTYFQMDGHHVQFNVVDTPTLRQAQRDPGAYRGLMVQVTGYSDYFCNLGRELQEEIITRTAHEGF